MLIIFFSKTGNIKRFVNKIEKRNIQGMEDLIINEPFILITYTINYGEIPKEVATFLKKNKTYLSGVVGSGNKNWGILYCKAASDIAKQYNVENIYNFELAGNKHQVEEFKKIYEERYE